MKLGRRDDDGRSRALAPGSPVALLAVIVLVSLAGCLGGAVPEVGPDTAETTDVTGVSDAPGASAPRTLDSAANGTLSIHFIHVGQGASVLVVGPSGETLLYDTGNWRDDGEHVIDYLEATTVSRIDYLVTSHADADHVGGHAAVIDHFETEAGGVGAVYDPGIAAATRTYESYLDAVERHDVTLYRTQAGDEIPMAGASVDVLAPPEGYLADRERNENSLVLRVGFGNASVLLPGDAGGAGERYLTSARAGSLNATVLGAGHHGSNSSSGPALLAATTPRIAVIQSAFDSPYGHPHREVLERFAARGVSTYWTGVHGDVVVETDGERVAVRTQRDAPTDPLELRSAPGVEPSLDEPVERRASFAVAGAGAGAGDSAGEAPESVVADGGRETTRDDAATTGDTGATTTSEPAGALVLQEIHEDAAGDDRENLADEYLVFRNAGDRPIDLSGWTVGDEAGHGYEFPDGTVLDSGETLTLRTGSGQDDSGNDGNDYYWNASGAVWNNAGDTVFVRTDEGRLVLEVQYDG
ncbi:lamin tail domain-containing protein [Halorussus litoreus]|uniref:lamin tail domain-containing protein n=1 Tax=Halorussus litoreus TaxID=1710536 RepID=UPI0018E515E6|nr:lamin tail domain-containing protein [Halorussus litoreus]